jgi:hypothetical protein
MGRDSARSATISAIEDVELYIYDTSSASGPGELSEARTLNEARRAMRNLPAIMANFASPPPGIYEFAAG